MFLLDKTREKANLNRFEYNETVVDIPVLNYSTFSNHLCECTTFVSVFVTKSMNTSKFYFIDVILTPFIGKNHLLSYLFQAGN